LEFPQSTPSKRIAVKQHSAEMTIVLYSATASATTGLLKPSIFQVAAAMGLLLSSQKATPILQIPFSFKLALHLAITQLHEFKLNKLLLL
jgi:hypothetical protein